LAEYKASNDIELKEKIPKNEIDFQNHAVEVSKLFILCFKDFRNRFKYCDEAQEIILKLDSACSVLILWNMEYSGGFELGDCIAEQNIKRIIGENYFPIDDFMKLYAEVKEA